MACPVSAAATQDRLQVAAIDFGTTYSGYGFSFRSDFKDNPLKIHTNKWTCSSGGSTQVSTKAPSCVLFTPQQVFHSFGYEAEDHYMELSADGDHQHWYFFKRFKMLLYNNKVSRCSTINGSTTCLQVKCYTLHIRHINERNRTIYLPKYTIIALSSCMSVRLSFSPLCKI